MSKRSVAVDAGSDGRLIDGPGPAAGPEPSRSARPPAAAVAAQLIAPIRAAGAEGLFYLATSERRADEIGRAVHALAPDLETLVLPPWDCLPYDRASPSHESMGRRMAVFNALQTPTGRPRLVVTSPDAVMQRIPPATACAEVFEIRMGDILDRAALEAFAARAGYVVDDRIDEPGEIAILGEVVDVFPPTPATRSASS